MAKAFINLCFLLAILTASFISASAQSDASDRFPGERNRAKADEAKSVKDMLAKQRLARDKKDHEEMLGRGEEALRLSAQLEKAFEQNKQISGYDKEKLDALEKIVTKIRKELGGDDDDEESTEETADKPSTLEEAFGFLQDTTAKLVDELKKTSRFSISAVAIQSSNTVIRLVRFLRLRK